MRRPPFPPFTQEGAKEKIRAAEDAWNGRDPARVARAYMISPTWVAQSDGLPGSM